MNDDKLAWLMEAGMSLDEIHRMQQDGLSTEEIAEAAERLIAEGKPLIEDEPLPITMDVISAIELQQTDIPPITFIVESLLPHGLNILASPPKYGKSWMVLALCLAISMGEKFLGHKTNKCGCLYLALEDSRRRLKSRMNKLLTGREAPAGFDYATTAGDMDNGLFENLERYLASHHGTGLIVIDTLQRVRGAARGKESAYAADYREVGALKAFADKHSIAILLVHHLRKMRDDGDPFNMISGTNGIMGAADTTMVLTKEARNDDTATFSVVGRDVESSDTILKFNKDTCRWENMGDADWYAEQQARLEYQNSPIAKTIKKLLDQSTDGSWTGSMKNLLEAGKLITGTYIASTPEKLSRDIKALEKPLFEYGNITHSRGTNGKGGGKHTLCYAGTVEDDFPQEWLE